MREILFRIKDRQHWYYGLPTRISETNVQFQGVDENGNDIFSMFNDKNTLGQFTGLIDRNNKKIFEGDIIKESQYGAISQVVFVENVCRFQLKLIKEGSDTWANNSLYSDLVDLYGKCKKYTFEIIGNVYDNPEIIAIEKTL